MSIIPAGYCHCGCGQRTRIATKNDASKGWVKGQPLRYLREHSGRSAKMSPRTFPSRRSQPVMQDMGFSSPCWVWPGRTNSDGYGAVWKDGRHRKVHRVFYEEAHGPIPEGMPIHHLCGVRACCNPDHLKPVSVAENARLRGTTRLTTEKVLQARQMRGEGALIREIAAMLGVSNGHAQRVVAGERWST